MERPAPPEKDLTIPSRQACQFEARRTGGHAKSYSEDAESQQRISDPKPAVLTVELGLAWVLLAVRFLLSAIQSENFSSQP